MNGSDPSPPDFFVAGGTLKADTPSYIERRADEELYQDCLAGRFAYVLTARQMGKSSLMARTARRLQQQGVATAIIDLSPIDKNCDADRWYFGIAHDIVRGLGLQVNLNEWWRPRDRLPPAQRWTEFFTEVLIENLPGRVVVFFDEIDSTIGRPFADDFFAAIRACYNARANDSRFDRLTMVLLGVATPDQLISDPSRTPFNIGHAIHLTDFSIEEARVLAHGFPFAAERNEELLRCILHWTDGHPYLTQSLCRSLAQPGVFSAGGDGFDHTVQQTVEAQYLNESASRQETNVKFVRQRLTEPSPLTRRVLQTYRQVRQGRQIPDQPASPVHARLKLTGAVKVRDGFLGVRNRIYQEVFTPEWVRHEMPSDTGRAVAIALSSLALLVTAVGGPWLWNKTQNQRTETLVRAVLSAAPETVAEATQDLRPFQSRGIDSLRQIADQGVFDGKEATPRQRLQAAFALADFGEARVPLLIDGVAEGPAGQCGNLVQALRRDRDQAIPALAGRFAQAGTVEERVRFATVALHLGDRGLAEKMLTLSTNPVERTAFIHRYPQWHGDLTETAEQLREVKGSRDHSDFLSGVCSALALIPWEQLSQPEQTRLRETMAEIYTTSPGGAAHSAAFCALTKWGQDIPTSAASLQPASQAPPDRDWFINSVGLTMIKIPAGSFLMGNTGSSKGDDDEKPVHKVTLRKPLWVSDREVTVELTGRYVREAGVSGWGGHDGRRSPTPDCPVQRVSWLEAIDFCNWLSDQEGRKRCYNPRGAEEGGGWEWEREADGYRLPSEAEWEYACRAMSVRDYCYGEEAGLLGEYAVYDANSDGRTWPAGNKLPNGWGLFDLHGNVSEWCWDWAAEYQPDEQTDPIGPSSGIARVLRGGSWLNPRDGVRSSNRGRFIPVYRYIIIGFRVVVSPF